MQRANLFTLIVVVVVIAAVVAAEWYWFDYRVMKAEYEHEGIGPMPETSNLAGSDDVSAETYGTRPAKIIKCEDPEVGTFYTDAESCEEAEPPRQDTHPQDPARRSDS